MTPALTRNKPLTTSTHTGNVSVTHMLTSPSTRRCGVAGIRSCDIRLTVLDVGSDVR